MDKLRVRVIAPIFFCFLIGWLLLAACGDNTATSGQLAVATVTVPSSPTAVATSVTTAPVPTSTTAAATTTVATSPTQTTVALATTAPGMVNAGTPVEVNGQIYIDDRSDPIEVLRSFYNAINQKQYVRAYSYWNTPVASGSNQLPPYDQFAQGYADTTSVQLNIGQILGSAGAGNRYWEIPVALQAAHTSAPNQLFIGCYVINQSVPANFGAPPFVPMNIQQANVQLVSSNANLSQLLTQACQNIGPAANGPVTINLNTNGAYDAGSFLDDRSTPTELIRSYYNAINRKEYVRAYGYWEAGAVNSSQVQPYTKFAEGFKTTASVQITLGNVISNPGAGQLNYQVPITVITRQIGDRVQTYVGCFSLHQAQPSFFGTPPFAPMGITKANLQEVQINTADTTALMAQACSQS